jgi:arsenite oxidase small subunit
LTISAALSSFQRLPHEQFLWSMVMDRRSFIAACGAGCGLASLHMPAHGDVVRNFPRSVLTAPDGRPFRTSVLEPGRNYVFHWPFPATPCFLLDIGEKVGARKNLRTASGHAYDWPGGVGPRQSVVAYSAICSHRLTHPTRDISFIAYRDKATSHSPHDRVIHCCSVHSQFDATAGARVLSGPAPQPLATIVLDYSAERDELSAIGTLGADVFDRFFSSFGFRLALEHGGKRATKPVGTTVIVQALDHYCRQQVRC